MFDLNLLSGDPHLVDLPRTGPEAARLIETSYLRLSAWTANHLPRIGTLIVGVSLSLYGRYVTEGLRRVAYTWPFPLRAGLFISVVGLGFAAVIAACAPLVTAGLRSIGTPYLVPAILSAFILLGILAERSGRI